MTDFFCSSELHLIAGESPLTFTHVNNFDSPKNHQLHINNYIEVYVYISGDADYIVGDSYYSLKKGDIIVINPQEVHKVVLKSECQYERFYMLIPTNAFDKFVFNPLSEILNRSPGNPTLVSLVSDKRKNALEILYKTSELCNGGLDENTQMMAYSLIIRFLCLLNSNLNSLSDGSAKKSYIPKLLSEVLVYINQNLPFIQSLSEIAEHFDVTPPYLSTLFKKHIGTSIKIYIRTQRVALAKKLLNEGFSVTDACYESGFNDCSYFIKHFKQCMGITPLQYKIQTGISEKLNTERK